MSSTQDKKDSFVEDMIGLLIKESENYKLNVRNSTFFDEKSKLIRRYFESDMEKENWDQFYDDIQEIIKKECDQETEQNSSTSLSSEQKMVFEEVQYQNDDIGFYNYEPRKCMIH